MLQDKVVLVSGGTQGVGAGIARAAARAGAAVVVTGRRPELGEQAVADLRAEGAVAVYVSADVADAGSAQASVAQTVERFGRIDGLVNAAGLTTRGTLVDTSPELFDAHIAVNLRGPFFLMQAAVKDMIRRGEPGSVVNIISMAALGGQPYLAPYVAAKAGLIGLTKNAAHAHRWDRIRINGINIGWTQTEGRTPLNVLFMTPTTRAAAGGHDPADGQARAGRRRRPPCGAPAVARERRRHRLDHRLGPERPRRVRLVFGGHAQSSPGDDPSMRGTDKVRTQVGLETSMG